MRSLEDRAFIVLVIAATLAFAWIMLPFFAAILWAIVIAVIFSPLHARLLKEMPRQPNLAAFLSVFLITILAILPLFVVGMSLSQQASSLYYRIQSNEIDLMGYLARFLDALPSSIRRGLGYFGIPDAAAAKESIAAAFAQGKSGLAAGAFGIGLGAFDFVIGLGVMLYLMFFLLRDGEKLTKLLKETVPLRARQKTLLFSRFSLVIRGTVKGGLAVAAVQGALGGIAFWLLGIPAALLWGVVMAVLSLLPAIGAALVWGPVAIYLLISGAIWQGVLLVIYGVVIIGLVDNLLRPFLIGRSTKLPDYMILISTLGGIELFGLNGFVVGPLVAAMFVVSWEIYGKQRITSQRVH